MPGQTRKATQIDPCDCGLSFDQADRVVHILDCLIDLDAGNLARVCDRADDVRLRSHMNPKRSSGVRARRDRRAGAPLSLRARAFP
jgi:hypothetical protein